MILCVVTRQRYPRPHEPGWRDATNRAAPCHPAVEATANARGGITDLMDAGALVHNIAARRPLQAIADAHGLVEQGRVAGNVVVEIAPGIA